MFKKDNESSFTQAPNLIVQFAANFAHLPFRSLLRAQVLHEAAGNILSGLLGLPLLIIARGSETRLVEISVQPWDKASIAAGS